MTIQRAKRSSRFFARGSAWGDMLALIYITAWHWVAFIFCVLIFLALDLGVFHRRAHVVRFREALLWTSIWFCLAMLFAVWLRSARGQKEGLQFVTGYLIELSTLD